MIDDLNIALIQYDVAWKNIDANLDKVDYLLSKPTTPVDLIVLPEMFTTGFIMEPESISMGEIEKTLSWMIKTSISRNAFVLGSIPYFEQNKYYNRLLISSPSGTIEHYDKRHLFAIGGEDKKYTAGKTRKTFDIKGWKMLPLICFDLRFPVWSRNQNNFDLLIFIANWPAARNNVWETLLKARAIENQCYTVGLNRIGVDGQEINYIGNSQIIFAGGEVLRHLGSAENISLVSLNKTKLMELRESFPVLNKADRFSIIDTSS